MGRGLRLCLISRNVPLTVPYATYVQKIPTGKTPTNQPAVPHLPDRKRPTASNARDNTMKTNISIKFILFPIGGEGVSSYGNSRARGALTGKLGPGTAIHARG